MDLGGASTQITFETREEIESRPANEVTLRLYGQTYKVYTHSFLCYGRDQILKRLLSKVLKVRKGAKLGAEEAFRVGLPKGPTHFSGGATREGFIPGGGSSNLNVGA